MNLSKKDVAQLMSILAALFFGLGLAMSYGCASAYKPELNEDTEKLRVNTNPPGADVWLNAEYLGKSPVTVDRPAPFLIDTGKYLPVFVYAEPVEDMKGCSQSLTMFNPNQVPKNLYFRMEDCSK